MTPPDARAVIDRIAAADVGTVVPDVCHHLRDYWAIVLRALITLATGRWR